MIHFIFKRVILDQGVSAFEFVSKNTNVEVGHIISQTEVDMQSNIFTDGYEAQIDMISQAISLMKDGCSIKYLIHSHPGDTLPSGFNEG